jgi:hypothetical protein
MCPGGGSNLCYQKSFVNCADVSLLYKNENDFNTKTALVLYNNKNAPINLWVM